MTQLQHAEKQKPAHLTLLILDLFYFSIMKLNKNGWFFRLSSRTLCSNDIQMPNTECPVEATAAPIQVQVMPLSCQVSCEPGSLERLWKEHSVKGSRKELEDTFPLYHGTGIGLMSVLSCYKYLLTLILRMFHSFLVCVYSSDMINLFLQIYTGCYDGSIQAVRLNLMQNYRCWVRSETVQSCLTPG